MVRKRKNVRSFLDRVKELFLGSADRAVPGTPRRLRFEGLENRRVMATDVGLLAGHVYRDTNGSGQWESGEAGLEQAQVQLWRDNGDGVLNTAADTLVSTVSTNAAGAYSFGNLALGDYFLRRPAQTLAGGQNKGIQLTEKISSKIHIAALKMVIDDFDSPSSQTAAADTTNDNAPATSIASGLDSSKTIGGEREIITNFTGDAEGPGILASARVGTINVKGKPEGLLLLDATSSAKGTYTLVWDGADGIATTTPNLNAGLPGVNLTADGADHLRIKLNSLDLPGAVVRVTVYTDATHFSTGTVALLPRVIDGEAQAGGNTDYRFDFSGAGQGGFQLGVGATGGANFTSVRAVVMSIDVPSDVDARLELLGAYGSANEVADLAVDEVDVSVDKQVDNPTPTVGTLVNYVLTVSNAATLPNGKPAAKATGVTVDDTLFTSHIASGKLSYVSDNSNGSFNAANGVWNVGEINPGQSKSIIVTMRVNQAALPSVTNTMKIVSVFQPDPDTNDWTDSETITPTYVDIAVTKTVDTTVPLINTNAVFTITVTNNGSGTATGVSLFDAWSSGLAYGSSSATQGSFDPATKVWTVGTIGVGQTFTLTVTTTVTSSAAQMNTVEVFTADQTDVDSAPNNGRAGEDDIASVALQPQVPIPQGDPTPQATPLSKRWFLAR